MTPEVHVEVEPTRILPRLGHGVCWSQVVAEIAEDAGGSETGGNAPNPWTPDPDGEAA